MAPTALDRGTRFQRQNDGRGRSLAYTQEPIIKAAEIVVSPPWNGYAPDLTDDLSNHTFAESASGVIERDGDLVNIPGYYRFENSSTPDTPLGDTTLPASSGAEEPIVGLFQAATRDGSSSHRIAVTAMEPTAGTEGHVYFWDGTDWNVSSAVTTDHTSEYTTTDCHLIDFAYFPWGQSGSYTGTAGQIIFVNGVSGDSAYMFPNNTNQYFVTPFTGLTGLTNAKSVSNYFSRICLFHTIENGTAYPHRFRWFAPASLSSSDAGSGYFDVDEVQGKGLRCLPIADNNALYFDRGVAFVSRSGSKSAPFRVDYITKQRGLVGPQALCSIGSGSHFGIFTDGWLVLDANGQFTELGILNNNGRTTHKWLNTFYDDLSTTYDNRTVVGFDTDNHTIIISYCSRTNTLGYPDKVLYYDLKNDTLWPDDFGVKSPTAFSEFDSSYADITWDEATGDWDEATRSYDIDIATGNFQLVHGTYGGLVLAHSRAVNTKDGQSFISSFVSKKSKGTSLSSRIILDKLAIEYQRVAPSTAVLDLQMKVDDTTSTRSIILSKGNPTTNQLDFITNRMSGRRFGWGVSGLAPLRIKGVQMTVFIEGDDEINHGS